MRALRAVLIASLAVASVQALVSDRTRPYGARVGSLGGKSAGVRTAAATGEPAEAGASASDSFAGRILNAPGYGTYLCYAKRLWGDQSPPADATLIRRLTLAAPERVPGKGAVPTAAEVAAWAAGKLGVDPQELVPEELSNTVTANDWIDDKGVRHVRLVQWSEALEASVELGAVIVHMHGNNASFVTGGVVPDLDARTDAAVSVASGEPSFITESEAAAIAMRAALATLPRAPKALTGRLRAAAARPSPSTLKAAAASPTTARLVHCSKDGACAPAYKQVIFLPATGETDAQELHVYVGAVNGSVLLMANRLRTARRPRSRSGKEVFMSLGRGASLYSGEVPVNTAQTPGRSSGTYSLRDLIHNTETFDMNNKEDSNEGAPVEELFRDEDNAWGDGTVKDRSTVAVDAHFGATTTLSYYKDTFGRNGVDGRGTLVKSRVHLSKNYDNAYWFNMKMTYGDGSRDARFLTSSCKGFPPMVTLDITAHEMAHGVTEYTSGLIYEHSYGGINEGLSDIFAQCVVDYAHENLGYPRAADFLVGSQLYPPGANCTRKFLRSMIEPTADNFRSSGCWHPKFDVTFNETHGGTDMWCEVDVHWSSGVANRAFYLMARGLNVTSDCARSPQTNNTNAPAETAPNNATSAPASNNGTVAGTNGTAPTGTAANSTTVANSTTTNNGTAATSAPANGTAVNGTSTSTAPANATASANGTAANTTAGVKAAAVGGAKSALSGSLVGPEVPEPEAEFSATESSSEQTNPTPGTDSAANPAASKALPHAIGIKDSCAIFYRTTRAYLSRVADYYELRAATLRAAEDIYGPGSPQAAAVTAAWDIVGAPRGPYPNPNAPACQASFATKACSS